MKLKYELLIVQLISITQNVSASLQERQKNTLNSKSLSSSSNMNMNKSNNMNLMTYRNKYKTNFMSGSEITLDTSQKDKRKQKILDKIIDTNVDPAMLEEILAIKQKNRRLDPRLRHKSFMMRMHNQRFKEGDQVNPDDSHLSKGNNDNPQIEQNNVQDLSMDNENDSTKPTLKPIEQDSERDIKSILGEEQLINFDKHVDSTQESTAFPDSAEIIKPKLSHVSGVDLSNDDGKDSIKFEAQMYNPDIFNKTVKKMNNVMIVDNLKKYETNMNKKDKNLLIQDDNHQIDPTLKRGIHEHDEDNEQQEYETDKDANVQYKTQVFQYKPKFEHDDSVEMKHINKKKILKENEEQNDEQDENVSIIKKKKKSNRKHKKLEKSQIDEIKQAKIDKIVQNIIKFGDSETKNELIQLLISKLQDNSLNISKIAKNLQEVKQSTIGIPQTQPTQIAIPEQSIPQQSHSNLSPYGNLLMNQSNIPNKQPSTSQSFDPMSIQNNNSSPQVNNNPIPSAPPVHQTDEEKSMMNNFKSQGPLGVKYSQLKSTNIDLLKNAFTGLQGIGLDVKDIASSAMNELKKQPDFKLENLKDINKLNGIKMDSLAVNTSNLNISQSLKDLNSGMSNLGLKSNK